MEKNISCCGLNCATCEAYIATITNDNNLRISTAEKWHKHFDAPFISPDSIRCYGCKSEGIKFQHCNSCMIRVCVDEKGMKTCAECNNIDNCELVGEIHKISPEALENLNGLNSYI